MKLQEVEQEALALTESDRVALVLSLMDTIAPDTTDVSDEEALSRDAEMESGKVAPMMHDEFVRKVQAARRKK